jgi:hypothetical protein
MFVVDLDTIPLAEPNDENPTPAGRVEQITGRSRRGSSRVSPSRSGKWVAIALIVFLGWLHGFGIWSGLDGWAGLTNGYPLWRDDHPLYYHSALVTRSFLRSSWTTAGYDPLFMAGYAKSIIFPSSSTLPELALFAFGGKHPDFAYKIYVLLSAAVVPWLIALACLLWRVPVRGTAIAVLLYLLYVWSDFPINYVFRGMLPYFLAVPVALAAMGAFSRFITGRALADWLISVILMSLAFLTHFTSAMIVVPAAAIVYFAACARGMRQKSAASEPHARGPAPADGRAPEPKTSPWFHLAVWLIPAIVLTVNAFWWLPGIWLASTKGLSDFAFAHPEGVGRRFLQILVSESPIEAVIIAAGLPGLFILWRRGPTEPWALVGFCGAGLFWGYLAGASRSLDFLQPGRHTYAFYSALAIAGGVGLDELFRRVRVGARGVDHLDCWLMVGLVVLGIRLLGFPLMRSLTTCFAGDVEVHTLNLGPISLIDSIRFVRGAGEPFLSSRPSPRLLWVIDQIAKHVHPGQRLLFEEGGKDLPDQPNPYQLGRFSGLIPNRTGVEVIGGPYLHASLETNFTQFGEGMLFGRTDWDRAHFVKYAKLYRPSAIMCWSAYARRFCEENPDLVKVLDDDGYVLIGRVVGFEGDFIEGGGRVEASPGRIRLSELSPGLDGSVLLRYHSVPYLKASPSVALEAEKREDDPVPFIRLRPPAGTRSVELELKLPGWR